MCDFLVFGDFRTLNFDGSMRNFEKIEKKNLIRAIV